VTPDEILQELARLERRRQEGPALRECHDCRAKPGEPHRRGCDTELCSVCGGQRLCCECDEHDPLFARWTGIWPLKAEACYLGLDLNEIADMPELIRIFAVKPKA
jgi:hypothetical protein